MEPLGKVLGVPDRLSAVEEPARTATTTGSDARPEVEEATPQTGERVEVAPEAFHMDTPTSIPLTRGAEAEQGASMDPIIVGARPPAATEQA